MSIVCRRRGCDNTLTDEDENKGYEHCSAECIEALNDLEEDELQMKQSDHDEDGD